MKAIHETVFMSALRSFFVALFGVLGALIALFLVVFALVGLFVATEDKSLPSNVKILPDAKGKRKELASSAPVILQIDVKGKVGEGNLTGEKVEEVLLDSREKDFKKGRVKGILLNINTPGGAANDSDVIYRHLKTYKERYDVPVFAYVNGMCASGGYYIACAADKIYASDSSLIGSIGVLAWPPFLNLADTLEKLGVKPLTLSAGKGKDELNPFRPWKEGEQKHYQKIINFFYREFVAIVSENRQIPVDFLVDEVGAEAYPSPKALDFGLIDGERYTRALVLEELAEAAGIEGKYQVVSFETSSWWQQLYQNASQNPLITGKIKHELSLPNLEGYPLSFY
ncbi:MAG: putative signal peptide peptidase SppA [Chlamydiae bacterium]|nr:putative signal peptide peptidase SppA [Chlamydiota bacterium]